MSTLRLCMAMRKRNSHVKSVRRSSTPWHMSVNIWLVSIHILLLMFYLYIYIYILIYLFCLHPCLTGIDITSLYQGTGSYKHIALSLCQLTQRICRSPVRHVGSRSNAVCLWKFTHCSILEKSPFVVRWDLHSQTLAIIYLISLHLCVCCRCTYNTRLWTKTVLAIKRGISACYGSSWQWIGCHS